MARPASPLLLRVVGIVALAAALPVGHLPAGAGERWAILLEVHAHTLEVTVPTWAVELGRTVKPVFLVLGLALAVLCYRRSRRRTAVLLAVILLANLTIQAIKYPLLFATPPLGGVNPLSGHTGLVAAVCLGWLVVAPAAFTAVSAVGAVLGITAVAALVTLAGWHTPAQVACCLLICAGWALIGASFLKQQRLAPQRWQLVAGVGAAIGGGGLLIVALARASTLGADWAGNPFAYAGCLAVLAGFAMALLTVGSVLALTGGRGRKGTPPPEITAAPTAVGSVSAAP